MKRSDKCLGCRKPMRPNKAKLADHPGTVMHHGRNLCQTCYVNDKHQRSEQRNTTKPLNSTVMRRMEKTQKSTASAILDRRRRGIPATGQRMINRRPQIDERPMSHCCSQCKTPYVCANRYCICHALQLDTSLRSRLPYADPTGNRAVRNTSRRTQPKRNRQQR